MRYLVTGAAGFIGSSITDRLLAEGHTVIGIDNFETGQTRNIHPDAKVIRGDIADWPSLVNAFSLAEPDVVIHCAASYKDPSKWRRDLETNAIGSAQVAKLATAYNSRVVYFQTALCYGTKPATAYCPCYQGNEGDPVAVDQPLAPDSSYAISKTAGEQYIANSGVPYISFRLANIYGPRNLSGPIPTFVRNITEGRKSVVVDSRRDFVFVDDLIDLVFRGIDRWSLHPAWTGIVHCSTGKDFGIPFIFETVAAALGQPDAPVQQIPRSPDDAPSILLDPTETIELFNWQALTPLGTGIERAVEWYRNNPVGETFTHLALPAVA